MTGSPKETSGTANRENAVVERRVVLIGASNIARALPTVLATGRQSWGYPLDFMTAAGHGRGYGTTSWVLGRSLPPIVDCGLWDDLARRPHLPTAALLTDVGNDLVFMATAERIAAWVRICLQRLESVCERITLTQLPLESLQRLDERSFLLMRFLLFPRSRLKFDDALSGSQELCERLVELARQFGTGIVKPRLDWYGWDPIHIRSSRFEEAWTSILGTWQCERSEAPSIRVSRCIKLICPQHRRLFGIPQRRLQPAGKLSDGSSLSFY